MSAATSNPHIIAVYNHKGGVGKTTSSLNLSVCLAAAGHRTLLVDIDPQQSSTTILSRTGTSPSLVDVLKKQAVIEDAIHETVVENLFIIPSTRSLTLLETGLDERLRQNQGLKTFLNFSDRTFDFVVIDCPPAMGLLSLNALVAADSVVIPTTSGAFSLQGVARTVETVNALRGGLNPSLNVNGVLISVFEDTQRDRQALRDLGKQFPGLLYRHRVRFDPEVLKAEVKRQPSCAYNPTAPSTQDYAVLTAELLGRVHRLRRGAEGEFDAESVVATIHQSLGRAGFATLKSEDAVRADEAEAVREEEEVKEARAPIPAPVPEIRRGGHAVMLLLGFLLGFLCGGAAMLWFGPDTLTGIVLGLSG